MKKTFKQYYFIVILVSFVCLTGNIYSTEGDVKVVDFILEPIEIPDSAGPVIMKYGFTIKDDFCTSCKCCDELEVEIITKGGMVFQGESHFIAQLSDDTLHSFYTTFPVTILPNDTSSIRVILKIGNSKGAMEAYFVTTGELVEFWKGYPSGRYWKYPKFEPDTNKYEIKIDLRNNGIRRRSSLMELFEEEYGKPVETSDTGIFILKLPRGGLEHLRSSGFKCEYIIEPPPKKPGPPGSKTRIEKRNKPSNNTRQKKTNKDPSGEVWIDHVDGEDGWGRLYPNMLIRIILGLDNNYGDNVIGFFNGFRVYSVDGATWTTTDFDTLGTLDWGDSFDFLFSVAGYQSVTGSGADSIKFSGWSVFGDGLPSGFYDTALAIIIGPIPTEDVGKTICFDSSFVGGTEN